ncbi:hypothetical protein LY78DRAFT_689846 [Colletotrichum sublineola]|nr:hypothetical protein LY78DRAFT_689846 [Colletotrichum sublineola]
MASVVPSEALPALNSMPTEILDLIFAHISPINLWHLRLISKRFNAVLHPHLLSTSRASFSGTKSRPSYPLSPSSGDESAVVDEFTRTYILRSHFNNPALRSDNGQAVPHMRSARPQHSVLSPPELDHWVHGVTFRDRPPEHPFALRMRRRPWRSHEYNEARKLIFASHGEFERYG